MRRKYVAIGATGATAIFSLAAVAAGAPTPVTAVLGITLFASTGCVWAAIILGRRGTGLERAAVGTGLALATPVLGGLVLQLAGVPLHRLAWTGLLAGVTLAGDAILLAHRSAGRPSPSSNESPVRLRPSWHAALFGVAVAVAAGAVALASVAASIQHYPGFTQLWLSAHGSSTTAANLGVTNQQNSLERYRLVLLRSDRVESTWNLRLANGQTWQRTIPVSSTYTTAANLYILPDISHPYRHVSTGSGGLP